MVELVMDLTRTERQAQKKLYAARERARERAFRMEMDTERMLRQAARKREERALKASKRTQA